MIRIGSRSSPLAQRQAENFQHKFSKFYPHLETELVLMSTKGDQARVPLRELGGKSLFSSTLHDALLLKHINLAVHSLKDLETPSPLLITVACIFDQEDPRDVLLVKEGRSPHWVDLPKNALVGTCSLRRSVQALVQRPDLRITPLRGNIQTRIDALRTMDGIILAFSGLKRLGISLTPSMRILPIHEMMPAVGQGCLAVDTLSDNESLLYLLAPLNHPEACERTTLERAFLVFLEGSCHTAVGVDFNLSSDLCVLKARYARGTLQEKEIQGRFEDRFDLAKELAMAFI